MHCAKERKEKTDIKGTVPARFETTLASNKTEIQQSYKCSELNYRSKLNYYLSIQSFVALVHHLTNSSKRQEYFGLASKSGNTEDSYFSLCNLCSIAPYACHEKLMLRLGGGHISQYLTCFCCVLLQMQDLLLYIPPYWASMEVTGHCLHSNTSTSVFWSLTHNPKCKLKTEVKPGRERG